MKLWEYIVGVGLAIVIYPMVLAVVIGGAIWVIVTVLRWLEVIG